jgi:hypothetical protein
MAQLMPGNGQRSLGLSNVLIGTSNAEQTIVADLVAGTYLFKLRVTDAGGLYDDDTVQVQVIPPKYSTDVYFFFRDPTGSLDKDNIPVIPGFDSVIVLAKVTIAGYPDALIHGVWSLSYSPYCPIDISFENLGALGIFSFPPGTYSWTAQSVNKDFTGYRVPDGFASYWSTPHKASGTFTVPPGPGCILKEIVF